jgi:hypothetical protein
MRPSAVFAMYSIVSRHESMHSRFRQPISAQSAAESGSVSVMSE